MFYNSINLYIMEGDICRRQNNRDSLFGPLDREPAIQKLPKYGMRDPHMLYKITFHTLYRNCPQVRV